MEVSKISLFLRKDLLVAVVVNIPQMIMKAVMLFVSKILWQMIWWVFIFFPKVKVRLCYVPIINGQQGQEGMRTCSGPHKYAHEIVLGHNDGDYRSQNSKF